MAPGALIATSQRNARSSWSFEEWWFQSGSRKDAEEHSVGLPDTISGSPDVADIRKQMRHGGNVFVLGGTQM